MAHFLSRADSQEWLGQARIVLGQDRNLVLPYDSKGNGVFAPFPQGAKVLAAFAHALVHWLPNERRQLLWLQNWESDPPYHVDFYQRARGDASVPLIDAPGQMFDPRINPDVSLRAGLTLLTICYDWDAYFVSENGDCFYLSDGFVTFLSSDNKRIKEASGIFLGYEVGAVYL